MNDDVLKAAYQAALHARKGGRGSVALERIVALVEGEGSEAERLETLDLVMADEVLRHEFELLRAAAAGGAVTEPALSDREVDEAEGGPEEVGIVPGSPERLQTRFPFPLRYAALFVVALGAVAVWNQMRSPVPEPLRDGEADVLLVAPAPGEVSVSPTFVWRAVEGAVSYRLELLTEGGEVVVDLRTSDTTFALTAPLQPDQSYRWWVTATLAAGIELRAAPRLLTANAP